MGAKACLVPGCGAPVLHKAAPPARVCPSHRADMLVMVSGKELRFCQKCRRLQPVDAFDGTKHTCRRQLELNNARRRAAGPNPSGARLDFFGAGDSCAWDSSGSRYRDH